MKKKLFFTTEFILNLLVVRFLFLSLPSSCTLIFDLFYLSMMDAKCAVFYFSMVFSNCFHMIIQAIKLGINFIFALL